MAARKNPGPGKPKGAISKRTLDLMSEFEARHFNIVEEALRVYTSAIKCFEESYAAGNPKAEFLEVGRKSVDRLMEYVYPKRRAVEVTGKDGEALVLTFSELISKAASSAVIDARAEKIAGDSPEQS